MEAAAGRTTGAVRHASRPAVATIVALAVVAAVAIALRIAWAQYSPTTPDPPRFDDSAFYYNVAQNIAEGRGYVHPASGLATAQWPPGYPAFLASIFVFTGPSVTAVELANAALGALTAVLAGVLALLLLRDRLAAVIAAACVAVMPSLVMAAGVVWSETLFTAPFVLALVLVVVTTRVEGRERWAAVAALGIVTAAAAYTRDAGLVLVPAAAAYWLRDGMPRADALRSTAVVAAIAVLLILPWSVRNYRAIDGPALISSSAAGNFWEGHHEPGRVSNDVVLAHGPLSRPGGETDVSRAMWREGWEYVRSHPWEEIKAPFWKTRDLYKGDPAGLDLNDAYGLTPFTSRDVRERWLLLSDVAYYTLLIAAGIGLLASGWRSPLARLVAPVVLLWTLGHVAFFVTPRFHLPLLPVFAVAAGAGFAWAGRDVGARVRARRIFDGRRGQAIALVAALAAAGSGAALLVAQQPAPESSADVAGGATRDDDRAGSAFTEVVHEPDIGGHRRRAAGHRGSRVRTAGRIGGRPHGLGPTTRDTTSTATDR